MKALEPWERGLLVMANDLEKLLSAVQGGKLSQREMQEVGKLLLRGLNQEQRELTQSLLSDPKKAQDFLNTPEVKNILKDQ